jgi:hypothetical protein
MPVNWTDPESLEGDALRRWYLRSPAEVEQERQAAADRRYQDFFYGASGRIFARQARRAVGTFGLVQVLHRETRDFAPEAHVD